MYDGGITTLWEMDKADVLGALMDAGAIFIVPSGSNADCYDSHEDAYCTSFTDHWDMASYLGVYGFVHATEEIDRLREEEKQEQ